VSSEGSGRRDAGSLRCVARAQEAYLAACNGLPAPGRPGQLAEAARHSAA